MTTVDLLAIGRARRYDTAVALDRAGLLRTLFAGGYPGQLMRAALGAVRANRSPAILGALTLRIPLGVASKRVRGVWAHMSPLGAALGRRAGYIEERERFSSLAGRRSRAPVVMAEQTEALEAFRLAHARGAKTALIMTGVAPAARESWLTGQGARWGGAIAEVHQLVGGGALIDRERTELALADVIISPSTFVTRSLSDEAAVRSQAVVEVDWPLWGEDFAHSRLRVLRPGEPLRVLFAGRVGVGKGPLYLAEALAGLDRRSFRCRFVGEPVLPPPALERCQRVGELFGRVAPSAMAGCYSWADVVVLPSLYEGRARVGLEALAAGVPVIATPNAGLPISDGLEGLIVPPRDSAAIRAALERLMTEPNLLARLSANALERAREQTIERYAAQLARVVEACR